MSEPITIEVPDDDVPRMIASLREQATRSRALALSCEQLANDMEAQTNQGRAMSKPTDDLRGNWMEPPRTGVFARASEWLCECGERCNPVDPGWRWDGSTWQHYHGYPIGHVPTKHNPAKGMAK